VEYGRKADIGLFYRDPPVETTPRPWMIAALRIFQARDDSLPSALFFDAPSHSFF